MLGATTLGFLVPPRIYKYIYISVYLHIYLLHSPCSEQYLYPWTPRPRGSARRTRPAVCNPGPVCVMPQGV